ncbi:transmembrane protein [Mycobacterium tuberculosis]|nr:transmembrane protein [Mycobacterium tuberculosis]
MPGVITNSESPTAADHDRITATRETLEDYTLRLAPRSYRRWPPAVVGISALGGIAYLADFAIGANVGITWGTANALCGIAIFALVVFVTGLPLAYYAARYNIDLDLITRGSGFAYTARWSPTSSLPRSRSSSLPWRARSWLRALS